MHPNQVISVAARLLALWLLVDLITRSAAFATVFRGFYEPSMYVPVIAALLLNFGLAVFLWFFPRRVARILVSDNESAPTQVFSPVMWFAIGCSLLGLWVLAAAIPGLIHGLFLLYLGLQSGSPVGDDWPGIVVSSTIKLVLGIWLLFGAKGVRRPAL